LAAAQGTATKGLSMLDLCFLLGGVALFAAMFAYVRLCERL